MPPDLLGDDVEVSAIKTKLLRYSRKLRLGKGRILYPSGEKHARIMAKLNITIIPIKKQLLIGGPSKSSRTSGEFGKKGERKSYTIDLEGDNAQSTMLKRVTEFNQ